MIVCYQTKLHFESVGASDQGQSATAIHLQAGGQQQKITRNAAHSSTNPRLIAYDSAQWNAHQAGTAPKPEGFVFLKGTDYYRTANATINMPKGINFADELIDFLTTDSKLQEKSMVLVNRASQGELSPEDGVLQFIGVALDEITAAKARLEATAQHPEALRALEYYQRYFTEYQQELNTRPNLLETILDLKISKRDGVEKLLKIRYKAIREAQLDQSALMQKIIRVQKEISNTFATKPIHFLAAFRTLIIETARTDGDRHRLEKLLNFSPCNYRANCKKAQVTKFETTKSLLSAAPHVQKIQAVAQEVMLDMRSLRVKETYQRAETIKTLRTMKNWTQATLGNEIKKAFPSAAASRSTISRIENRAKLVSLQIAQEFSHVFDVDPGLFMPHFFYE